MHKVFKTLMAALLAGCALVSCKEAGSHAGAPAGAVG